MQLIKLFLVYIYRFWIKYPIWMISNFFVGTKSSKWIFIFHHIPKTAGSSVNNILNDNFRVIKDYRVGWTNIHPRPININHLNNKYIISSHFDYSKDCTPESRYLKSNTNKILRKITFVRDPFELRISLFYYLKNNGQIKKGLSLEKFLFEENNYLAGHLKCSADNWKERIDSYEFIGVMEKFDLSLEKLATLLSIAKLRTVKKNVGKKKNEYNDSIKKEFIKRNELDYQIYNYSLGKLLAN